MTVFGGHRLVSSCCPYVLIDYNDVWMLSNANGLGGAPVWTQQSPVAGPPMARHAHAVAYDDQDNALIVIGGVNYNETQFLNDVWSIRDGVLHCKGKPTGYIRTDKDFDNYVLTVEQRHVAKGNGGQRRSRRRTSIVPVGPLGRGLPEGA